MTGALGKDWPDANLMAHFPQGSPPLDKQSKEKPSKKSGRSSESKQFLPSLQSTYCSEKVRLKRENDREGRGKNRLIEVTAYLKIDRN